METTAVAGHSSRHSPAWLATLNGRLHGRSLTLFMLVVLGHWAEHLVQAVQVYALDVPRDRALGVLGSAWPWLVRSEWLHYGYALVMLAGLFLLRHGFTGRARQWWALALGLQAWHHVEHLLLLLQAQTHRPLFGEPVPASVLQLFVPRVELHLFYNAVVFAPMVVAVVLHRRRPGLEPPHGCSCHRAPRLESVS